MNQYESEERAAKATALMCLLVIGAELIAIVHLDELIDMAWRLM